MLIGPSSASARATIRATASEPGDIRLDRNNAPASRRDFAGRCFRFRRAGRIVEANRRPSWDCAFAIARPIPRELPVTIVT